MRVLVVDDFGPWRDCVIEKLQGNPRWQPVGVAADGLEAVSQAQELRPDLILLDISLPKLDGIAAARQIRKVSPESKILFLSQCLDLEIAQEALRAGGHGYIVKSDADGELFPAMEAVMLGQQFLSAKLRDRSV